MKIELTLKESFVASDIDENFFNLLKQWGKEYTNFSSFAFDDIKDPFGETEQLDKKFVKDRARRDQEFGGEKYKNKIKTVENKLTVHQIIHSLKVWLKNHYENNKLIIGMNIDKNEYYYILVKDFIISFKEYFDKYSEIMELANKMKSLKSVEQNDFYFENIKPLEKEIFRFPWRKISTQNTPGFGGASSGDVQFDKIYLGIPSKNGIKESYFNIAFKINTKNIYLYEKTPNLNNLEMGCIVHILNREFFAARKMNEHTPDLTFEFSFDIQENKFFTIHTEKVKINNKDNNSFIKKLEFESKNMLKESNENLNQFEQFITNLGFKKSQLSDKIVFYSNAQNFSIKLIYESIIDAFIINLELTKEKEEIQNQSLQKDFGIIHNIVENMKQLNVELLWIRFVTSDENKKEVSRMLNKIIDKNYSSYYSNN